MTTLGKTTATTIWISAQVVEKKVVKWKTGDDNSVSPFINTSLTSEDTIGLALDFTRAPQHGLYGSIRRCNVKRLAVPAIASVKAYVT